MSWLVAGITAGASLLSNKNANEADRQANDIDKYQDLIDVERLAGDVAIQEYNMRLEQSAIESEQVATASAMGKRAEGGSFDRIQETGRDDMERNISRNEDELKRARSMGAISADAKDKSTRAKTTGRNINTATTGLLSFSKAFNAM